MCHQLEFREAIAFPEMGFMCFIIIEVEDKKLQICSLGSNLGIIVLIKDPIISISSFH